jgi:hypothetical protein
MALTLTNRDLAMLGNKIESLFSIGHSLRSSIAHTHTEQKETLDQLQLAHKYATQQMANPVTQKFYAMVAKRNKLTHAYIAAVNDYMNFPTLKEIDISGYTGKKGESIIISSVDTLKIQTVVVEILLEDGTFVESGLATLPRGARRWRYLTTTDTPALMQTKIKVKGIDSFHRSAVSIQRCSVS